VARRNRNEPRPTRGSISSLGLRPTRPDSNTKGRAWPLSPKKVRLPHSLEVRIDVRNRAIAAPENEGVGLTESVRGHGVQAHRDRVKEVRALNGLTLARDVIAGVRFVDKKSRLRILHPQGLEMSPGRAEFLLGTTRSHQVAARDDVN